MSTIWIGNTPMDTHWLRGQGDSEAEYRVPKWLGCLDVKVGTCPVKYIFIFMEIIKKF